MEFMISLDGAFITTSLVQLVGSLRHFPIILENSCNSSLVGFSPNNNKYAVMAQSNVSLETLKETPTKTDGEN